MIIFSGNAKLEISWCACIRARACVRVWEVFTNALVPSFLISYVAGVYYIDMYYMFSHYIHS